jgi:hypothetical protein
MHKDNAEYMLLPRTTWETALEKLERIGRIDDARTLAIEVSDALTRHAPHSWYEKAYTVDAPNGSSGEVGDV